MAEAADSSMAIKVLVVKVLSPEQCRNQYSAAVLCVHRNRLQLIMCIEGAADYTVTHQCCHSAYSAPRLLATPHQRYLPHVVESDRYSVGFVGCLLDTHRWSQLGIESQRGDHNYRSMHQ